MILKKDISQPNPFSLAIITLEKSLERLLFPSLFELPRYLLHILFAAKTTTYSEAACQLKTDMIIHPFAFRVHSHGLGRVVSGWKVTADQTWTLLGKRDPQLPQMFEEIKDKSITLRYGDTLGKNSIDIFF